MITDYRHNQNIYDNIIVKCKTNTKSRTSCSKEQKLTVGQKTCSKGISSCLLASKSKNMIYLRLGSSSSMTILSCARTDTCCLNLHPSCEEFSFLPQHKTHDLSASANCQLDFGLYCSRKEAIDIVCM